MDLFLPDRNYVMCACTCSYPLLSCPSAALGDELQDSQQCPQPQAEGKNEKHPPEAVRLHS